MPRRTLTNHTFLPPGFHPPSLLSLSPHTHTQYYQPQGFAIGTRVSAQSTFDNQPHPAEIVDKKKSDKAKEWSYYLHYTDFDKRLDEWLPASKVSDLSTLNASEKADPLGRVASGSASDLYTQFSGGDQKITRRLKRQYNETHHIGADMEELTPLDRHLEEEHQHRTRVKNIQTIEVGRYEMDTWYYSPYPEPYSSCEKLYICEYSLKYFRKKKTLLRHLAKLTLRAPPGDEIYRSPAPPADNLEFVGGAVTNPPISMFEVDGKKSKVYCQNLCLLSKLFLDHKTLYYDVDPFLFYVLCERDEHGYHPVGYFSKEKNSAEGNNLACILTFPSHQRKGYGRFLIAFSYELSKKEGKIGSPERPLSDLGAVSYRSYWTRVLLEALRDAGAGVKSRSVSIQDICDLTAIRVDDAVKALESLGLVKYWKGDYLLVVTQRVVEEHLKTLMSQKNIEIDTTRLHWTPFGGSKK
jgi:GNAT superfamily N-acetyltransferase